MRKLKYFVALGLGLVATVALGGLVQPAPVIVDLDNMTAQGDMVTARYSKNDTEFIGCGVRHLDDGAGGVFPFGFCQAEDADGDAIICVTFNVGLIDAIRGSSDFSFLTFDWDEEKTCTRIGFSTQSFYLPKKLGSNLKSGKSDKSDK